MTVNCEFATRWYFWLWRVPGRYSDRAARIAFSQPLRGRVLIPETICVKTITSSFALATPFPCDRNKLRRRRQLENGQIGCCGGFTVKMPGTRRKNRRRRKRSSCARTRLKWPRYFTVACIVYLPGAKVNVHDELTHRDNSTRNPRQR